MTLKIDGRPFRIDVTANPEMDSKTLLLSGFPALYLYGATASGPVWQLGTDTSAGAWTVTVNADTIEMALSQSDIEAIGQGRYEWALILALADGSKPSLIAGAFIVSRDARPSTSITSASFAQDGTGATITIEQTIASGIASIDGGTPSDPGTGSIDGGTP